MDLTIRIEREAYNELVVREQNCRNLGEALIAMIDDLHKGGLDPILTLEDGLHLLVYEVYDQWLTTQRTKESFREA